VAIQCGTGDTATWPATCGNFYVTDAAAVTLTFTGTAPTGAALDTFKTGVQNAMCKVTSITEALCASAVPLSGIAVTNLRRSAARSVNRRAGYAVSVKVLPTSAAQSVSSVGSAVATAAASPALNNAIKSATGVEVASVTVPAISSTPVNAVAATTTTTSSSSSTPAPVSAAVATSSVTMCQLVVVMLAALIAYMY